MKKITEDYVDFETARLLKEKGFAVDTGSDYLKEREYLMSFIAEYAADPSKKYVFYRTPNSYPCPTLQTAMKWLREVHNLPINIWYEKEDDTPLDVVWRSEVATGDYSYALVGNFSTYEEAAKAAIKYCLINLISV